MKKLLVTGGAGFIGSAFIRYTLARHPDYQIVNLDKLTYAGNLDNLRGIEERYEFVGGVLTLMAGGTENHDLISANAIGALYNRLRGSPCRVHGSNLKVRSPSGAIMYPDAFVRCGPGRGGR